MAIIGPQPVTFQNQHIIAFTFVNCHQMYVSDIFVPVLVSILINFFPKNIKRKLVQHLLFNIYKCRFSS